MPKNLHIDQPQCPYRIMLHMSLSELILQKHPVISWEINNFLEENKTEQILM